MMYPMMRILRMFKENAGSTFNTLKQRQTHDEIEE